jgi:hypothetical protein
MKQHRLWLVITISTLLVAVLCCGITAFAFGMLPPSEILARRYFHAVIGEDSKAAIALAGSEQGCKNILEEDVKKDIAQFGTAEIRNVIIKGNRSVGGKETRFFVREAAFPCEKL